MFRRLGNLISYFTMLGVAILPAWIAVYCASRVHHYLQLRDNYGHWKREAAFTSVGLLFWVGVTVAVWWSLLQLARGAYRESLGQKRLKDGKCPHCGYDLRSTPKQCPECGVRLYGGGVWSDGSDP